jgi:very-short-patch-repair endonuclease/predicted transcriptional regulator of viral defense system
VSFQRDSGSATHGVRVLGVRREVSISGTRTERIAAVARLQRGRIAFRQLRAIGIAPASVDWLVTRGRLLPSLRCVFRVGHEAPTELGAETDALLSVRDGAALSHWSAAALLGLWTPLPAVVDVTVDSSNAATNPGVQVHRSRILESCDVWIRKGLPVTSPARTLLDIAVFATARQLEVAFDRGIAERTLKLSHVRDLLARCGGHRGRARLGALLERERGGSTRTESVPEERMLALLRQAGLPEPAVNFPFETWKLDFYWPAARFAVEVDSYRFHASRYRFERDRRKDNALRRAKIEVMRIVDNEITGRSHGLVADVTRELARRGAL